MSRITYYDDWGDGYYTVGLWNGTVKSALNGRRGQAVLREIEAALLALPRKRLVENAGGDGETVCVLGALDWHRKVQQGVPVDEAMRAVGEESEDTLYEPHVAAEHLNLTYPLAFTLMEENDEMTMHLSPEERYEAVLAYVRKMIRVESPASGNAPTSQSR